MHAFWKIGRNVRVELVDLRVKALEVSEQELLTKDKESLRVHLNASYRFRDAQLTVRTVRDPVDFLYKEIQLGLRSAVAKRSLGALLEHKGSLDRDVFARVHDKLAALGIDLHGDRRQRARAHYAVAALAPFDRASHPNGPPRGRRGLFLPISPFALTAARRLRSVESRPSNLRGMRRCRCNVASSFSPAPPPRSWRRSAGRRSPPTRRRSG